MIIINVIFFQFNNDNDDDSKDIFFPNKNITTTTAKPAGLNRIDLRLVSLVDFICFFRFVSYEHRIYINYSSVIISDEINFEGKVFFEIKNFLLFFHCRHWILVFSPNKFYYSESE